LVKSIAAFTVIDVLLEIEVICRSLPLMFILIPEAPRAARDRVAPEPIGVGLAFVIVAAVSLVTVLIWKNAEPICIQSPGCNTSVAEPDWNCVPVPEDPKFSLPGCAFASATRSLIDCAGTCDATISTFGEVAIWVIGEKSVSEL
jgi:hypothetical protein